MADINMGNSTYIKYNLSEKTADISRRHHWFPRETTSEFPYW